MSEAALAFEQKIRTGFFFERDMIFLSDGRMDLFLSILIMQPREEALKVELAKPVNSYVLSPPSHQPAS